MAYEFFNSSGLNQTDYIQGTASLFTYPFTINFWFYPTWTTGGTLQMFVLHNTTDSQRHIIQINTSTTRLAYNAFTTANAVAATTDGYTPNAWNMATAVGTSSTSRTIYVNGGGAGSNNIARAITTPTKWLVAANYNTSNSPPESPIYDGRICEIGIWNVALGAADIASLYKGTKSPSIKPQNLKVYVPLIRDIKDEREATTAISSTISDTTIVEHVRRYG
jgi:hypothetical protein